METVSRAMVCVNDDFVLLKGLTDVSVSTCAAHLLYFSSNVILFLKRDVFLTVTTRSVFPCMACSKNDRTTKNPRPAASRKRPRRGRRHIQGTLLLSRLFAVSKNVHVLEGLCQLSACAPPHLQLAIFEFENFRGKKVELSGECKDACEKAERVGSVIVESGP